MPLYDFSARDRTGKMTRGQQEATSEATAVRILQSRDLVVTKIMAFRGGQAAGDKRLIPRHRNVRQEDLLYFITQTAELIDVGVPFIRTLELVGAQGESRTLADVIGVIRSDVRAGKSFRDALIKHPKVFPVLWSHLIEAGEASGNLPVVMKRLGQNIEANLNLKKKLVSAMIYPAVLIAMAVVALLVFMLKVIPFFTVLFKSLNTTLPPYTLAVIRLSDITRQFFPLFIFLAVTGVFFFRRYAATAWGKRSIDQTILNLPIFGDFVRDVVITRVSINLSTLLKSGVNIIQSLELVARAAGNAAFELALMSTITDIRQGKSFSSSLEQSGLFPALTVSMIAVGEESGKLSYMTEKVSGYYQNRVDTFVTRFGTLIEPVILIVIGTLVGSILVAMFLPIFSLGGGH